MPNNQFIKIVVKSLTIQALTKYPKIREPPIKMNNKLMNSYMVKLLKI